MIKSSILFICSFLIGITAFAKEPKYKIAILDTGYDEQAALVPLKLCKTGHYNYATKKAEVGTAPERHGTLVATIVASILEDEDYCAIIFQLMSADGSMGDNDAVIDALKRAKAAKVVAVNLSFRSGFYNWSEYRALKALSDDGVMLFAAAGNEHTDLNVSCMAYPACYRITNLIAVGALTIDSDAPASYSNYGAKVSQWFRGDFTSPYMQARGTSFAAPRALGYYVRSLYQIKQ